MKRFLGSNIIRLIVAIGILLFAVAVYYSVLFKNPVEYFKAKEEITKYIQENYKDTLTLGKVSYSSKMVAFVGQVTEKDDSRYKSYIAYYSNNGFIEDDYHFRTQVNMEDSLRTTITTIINSSTGIPVENINAAPRLEIPKYKYKMSDKYNPEEPIDLDMSINEDYESNEDFSVSAHKILESLYSSKLNFKRINIYSFTPQNGNEAYSLTLEGAVKPYSLEEVKDMVYIKGFDKK